MDPREKQDEKNKRIGWMTSVGVQLLLLILFYFIIAWKAPNPPIPEFGIELGFATSAGSSSASSNTEVIEEVETDETSTDTEMNEVEEVIPESIEQTESNESVDDPIVQTEVIEQNVTDVPVVEEETNAQEEVVAEEETTEEVVEEEQEVDQRALMSSSNAEDEEETNNDSEGEEDTEIDDRAIYGSQGTNTGANEGASLSLSGWIWDFKPKPDDNSDESGKIVYKIVVDQDGYLVKIEVVSSTVSPAVERKYRQAVEKLTFSKTADNQTAQQSSGKITFIIKSK